MLKKLIIGALIVASNFGIAATSEAAQSDYENYCGRYGGGCYGDYYGEENYGERNYGDNYCGGYGRGRGGC